MTVLHKYMITVPRIGTMVEHTRACTHSTIASPARAAQDIRWLVIRPPVVPLSHVVACQPAAAAAVVCDTERLQKGGGLVEAVMKLGGESVSVCAPRHAGTRARNVVVRRVEHLLIRRVDAGRGRRLHGASEAPDGARGLWQHLDLGS